MNPSSSTTIAQLGAIAHSCLASGQRGRVLAVFSKAIYLVADTSELFWIATNCAPMHRRCAIISGSLPMLTAGTNFHVDANRLMLSSDCVSEIDPSNIWHAPKVHSKHVVTPTELCARVRSFYEGLEYAQAKGFGCFIPHILSLSEQSSNEPVPEHIDAVLLFAKPFILDIARACLQHQPARVSQIANTLIGLGGGLTPSGDDFLGGMLFARRAMQTAYAGSGFSNYEIPVESFRLKTNLISFTLLSDLNNGHAVEPLHHIVNALFREEPLERIFSFVLKLMHIGHSTGWDLLTGLLVGLLITYRASHFPFS
jgi:hypothetical protein